MFNLLTYFLGACIGEGVVEMDVWIRIFAEKLRIIFKVCFRRKEKGRSAKCESVWREVRGFKNHWKCVDILHGCPPFPPRPPPNDLKYKWKQQDSNHLVCQRTLNHLAKLAKWLSRGASTSLYGVFDCMLS